MMSVRMTSAFSFNIFIWKSILFKFFRLYWFYRLLWLCRFLYRWSSTGLLHHKFHKFFCMLRKKLTHIRRIYLARLLLIFHRLLRWCTCRYLRLDNCFLFLLFCNFFFFYL